MVCRRVGAESSVGTACEGLACVWSTVCDRLDTLEHGITINEKKCAPRARHVKVCALPGLLDDSHKSEARGGSNLVTARLRKASAPTPVRHGSAATNAFTPRRRCLAGKSLPRFVCNAER